MAQGEKCIYTDSKRTLCHQLPATTTDCLFSELRSSSRTGFGLPLEETRKEADFFPARGNLSMTMWKQTQTIPAPSLPEPVLPRN